MFYTIFRPTGDTTPANALDALNLVSRYKTPIHLGNLLLHATCQNQLTFVWPRSDQHLHEVSSNNNKNIDAV